jgi:hypothetical protein
MVAFPGCELETEDYSRVNETNFPKNANHAKALLADMYSDFGFHWMSFFTLAGYRASEVVSDYGLWAWKEEVNYNYYEANYDWFSGSYENLWQYYSRVSAMMLNIERIRGIEDMDEDLKSSYIAELHCGIGWLAFILYDYFGTIPLPTLDVLQDPLMGGGILLERATDPEMREFIEGHLKQAVEALPYSHLALGEPKYTAADYGRFTKGLAQMALLKFYMLVGDWDNAEKTGRELMKPEHGYALMSNYNDIFTLEHEVNSESIFACVMELGVGESFTWASAVLPGNYNNDLEKYHMMIMTWPFYETFDPADNRLERIYAEYTDRSGNLHTRATDVTASWDGLYYGPIPAKYDFSQGFAASYSGVDFHIYRYADALTLLAEAIARNANAVTDEAFDLLNEVRKRAFPGNTGKHYVISQFGGNLQAFLDELLAERGRELYFENCRRQDLIRHGKFIEKAIEKNSYFGKSVTQLQGAVGNKYLKFPLPPEVITMGQGLIKQNPGY